MNFFLARVLSPPPRRERNLRPVRDVLLLSSYFFWHFSIGQPCTRGYCSLRHSSGGVRLDLIKIIIGDRLHFNKIVIEKIEFSLVPI